MAAIVADIRRELAAASLPQGFFASLEGTFQAQEEASRTIGILSLVSLALIFAILYSRYRSAVLAADHHGQRAAGADRLRRGAVRWPASRCRSPAMVGFITLAGIATRNGILKISHYINLALHEGDGVRAGA